MTDKMREFSGGKVTSSLVSKMHYVPTEALRRLAGRFETGVARRPDGTAWNACSQNQDVLLDREFILDRISHIIIHACDLRDKLIRGEDLLAEDDAGAIIWGGAFLCCATKAVSDQKPELNCSACGGFGNEWVCCDTGMRSAGEAHDKGRCSGAGPTVCQACKGTGKSNLKS